jgi:hypothetical protein
VAPHWAERISWDEATVFVNLQRETIKHSPEWHADAPVNREYETRLYDYYGRPKYWESEKARVEGQEAASVGAAASAKSDDTDAWF